MNIGVNARGRGAPGVASLHTMMIPPPPVITNWTSDHLLDAYISLSLACGRSKRSLKKKERKYFCFLMEVLAAELEARGVDAHRRNHGDTDLIA